VARGGWGSRRAAQDETRRPPPSALIEEWLR